MTIPVDTDEQVTHFQKETSQGMVMIGNSINELRDKVELLMKEKYEDYDEYNRGLMDGAILILQQLNARTLSMYNAAFKGGSDLVC